MFASSHICPFLTPGSQRCPTRCQPVPSSLTPLFARDVTLNREFKDACTAAGSRSGRQNNPVQNGDVTNTMNFFFDRRHFVGLSGLNYNLNHFLISYHFYIHVYCVCLMVSPSWQQVWEERITMCTLIASCLQVFQSELRTAQLRCS